MRPVVYRHRNAPNPGVSSASRYGFNERGYIRGDIMKPLATLVLTASLVLGALMAMVGPAPATPFADVPANHWASVAAGRAWSATPATPV